MSSPLDKPAGIETQAPPASPDLPAVQTVHAQAVEAGTAAYDKPLSGQSDPEGHPLVRDLMLNPTHWRIWPAMAVLRWLQRRLQSTRRIVFRSRPSLSFAGSEVHDVAYGAQGIDVILNAPGLATAGSPLPTSDIARIVSDYHKGGPTSMWLDGPTDGFMQVLELMQMRSDPAYALMTGGQIESFALVADIVGRSAPLSAAPGGELRDPEGREPDGAIGLAGLFLGPISSAGLSGLFSAFTGFPSRVEEFAGDLIEIAQPARLGSSIGSMLGFACHLPSAGIEVHLEGGDLPRAQDWARDPVRRRALHLLAFAYIGAPSPTFRLFLNLDASNAPPAALDGRATLGGLAVLGKTDDPVTLPLHA